MLEELGAIETSAGTSASGLSTGDTVLLPDGRSVVISDPPSTVVTSEGAQTLAPGIDPDGSARSAMSEISGRSQMSTATSTTTTEPPVPRGKRYLLNPGAPEEDQLWIYHKWDREAHRYSDKWSTTDESPTEATEAGAAGTGGTIEMQPIVPKVVEPDPDPTSIYDGDSDVITASEHGTKAATGPDGVDINTEAGSAGGTVELGPIPDGFDEPVVQPAWKGSLGVEGDVPDLPGEAGSRFDDGSIGGPVVEPPGPERPEYGYMLEDIGESETISMFEPGTDFTNVEPPSGIADYIGDIGNLSMSEGGFSVAGGPLIGFLKARTIDFGVGMLLQPLFHLIDVQTGNSWTSRMIQLNMATMGFLLAGDPFGLIAAPIGWMIQDFMQERERVLENDDPEKIKGKKFGWVREGTKWYPAVTESESKDEGFGTDRSVLMMQYGTKLKWIQEKGTGRWIPTFEKPRYKEFHVGKDEIYGGASTNEHRERTDPLRDFSLMSDEEATALLKNFAGGDLMQQFGQDDDHVFTAEEQAQIEAARSGAFSSFKPKEDRGWLDSWAPKSEGGNGRTFGDNANAETDAYGRSYAPTVDSIQDSRAALDFVHDYRHSPSGQVSGPSGDFWTGSIELRRVVEEQGSFGVKPGAAGPRFQQENTGRPAFYDMPTDLSDEDRAAYIRNTGLTRNDAMWDYNKSNFEEQNENKYYLDVFKKELKNLYTAQSAAATSMGFKKLYKNPLPSDEAQQHGDDFWWMNMIESGKGGNAWAHLYHDNSWDMPDITTAEQLHAELLDIEEAGDISHSGTRHYRNTAQQHYLAQKAIVRYWAQKIDGLGGGPQLAQTWYDNAEYNNAPPPFWQEGDNAGDDIEKYSLGWHYGSEDVENPIDGVQAGYTDFEKQKDDEIQQAMSGYDAWGITGGVNDPDFVSGRWDGDYEAYWESTGRDAPLVLNHETGEYVPMVWDPKENDWVPPEVETEQPDLGGDLGQEERVLTGKDVTKEPDFGEPLPEAEELQSDWVDSWGGGESQADAPVGWTIINEFAYAPDGTKFDLYDPALWDYDDELKAAAAAEQKAADAADDTEAKKAARQAAREAARDAKKAANAAAAAAAQKAADDAAAAQKAADDAAAQKAADAAAAQQTSQTTQGVEVEVPDHSDVSVYTYHHEDQFDFHHDSTVPHHIPTTKISADLGIKVV